MDGGGEVMIRLDAVYSGPQLARALGNDAEEMAYALKELSSDFHAAALGDEVAYYLGSGDAEAVAKYLRALAEAICPTEEM